MPAKADWDKWRRIYVAGDDDLTLASLSEYSGAPSYTAIRKIAAREFWTDQRRRFRAQQNTAVFKIVTEDTAAQDAARKIEQLIDIAEIQARHIDLAKKIQRLVGNSIDYWLAEGTILGQREIASLLKAGTELERLAVGLSTSKTETSITTTDVTALSDSELQALVEE